MIPPERADELAPILEQIRQGQRVEHFETKRLRKDGTVIDVSESASPIRNADGAVTGAATVTRDITEQRRAEAERQASEGRLQLAERLGDGGPDGGRDRA